MTLEEQNQQIINNIHNLSENQIEALIKQFQEYNANTLGAYDEIIELLENELINRNNYK